MLDYRKILEMNHQGMSQRTISSSTGHSRDKIREVVNEAKKKELYQLTEEMTNTWLEDYLFPEKSAQYRGYLEPKWDNVHKELPYVRRLSIKISLSITLRSAYLSGSLA